MYNIFISEVILVFNIGSSGLFQNKNIDNNKNRNTVSERVSRALEAQNSGKSTDRGLEVLKSMVAGDIVSGEVTDLQGNQALIKLANGELFSAMLIDGVDVILHKDLMKGCYGKILL